MNPETSRINTWRPPNLEPDLLLTSPELNPETAVEEDSYVETFLEEHAGLFASSQETWRQVRAAQQDFKENVDLGEFRPLDSVERMKFNEQGVRGRKRSSDRKAEMNYRVIFSKTHELAEMFYENNITPRLEGIVEHEKRHAIVLEHFPHPAIFGEQPKGSMLNREIFARNQTKILAYLSMAMFYDNEIVDTVKNFLSDREHIAPFIDRLHDVSLSAKEGLHEFPGLLETLAAHVKTAGDKNIFTEAIKRSLPDEHQLREEFIRSYLTESDKKTQSTVRAIFNGIKAAAWLMSDHSEWNIEHFITLFSRRPEYWPPELQAIFEQYPNIQIVKLTHQVEQSLTPFIKTGRLRTVGQVVTDTVLTPRTGKRRKIQTELPARAQDFNDVVEEGEQALITTFAIFKRNEGSRQYRLEPIENLEALLSSSMIQDYLKTHSSDKTLPDVIRQTFEQLINDPYNHVNTRRLNGTYYSLESDKNPRPRHLRRVSLARSPGISKGEIAKKTRIFYDVVRAADGQKCLAIYNIYIKQDVVNLRSTKPGS